MTLKDIRDLHQTANECRELWADPKAWQTQAMIRATALAGCRVGLCYEIADDRGINADRLLSAEDVGWESSGERHYLASGVAHQPLRYSPLWVQFADALPARKNGAGLTLIQDNLIDWNEWERSEMYDRYVRPTQLGQGIMSGVWMEQTRTWSCWSLVNDRSDGKLTTRHQRITRLLHRQIAGMVGTTLSTWRDRTVSTLSNVRRGVLDALLQGESEQQIADTMFRSRSAIHEHVSSLYRHFNVTSRSQLSAFFMRRQPKPAGASPTPPSRMLENWLNQA